MTSEVRVNPSFHRFLIGRNGANLRELSERTGARIVFPSPSDHDNDCILIIGQQDAISAARTELEARIKDLVFALAVVFCHFRMNLYSLSYFTLILFFSKFCSSTLFCVILVVRRLRLCTVGGDIEMHVID